MNMQAQHSIALLDTIPMIFVIRKTCILLYF